MADVHHFSAITGEFLQTTTARDDPIDKTPMVPGNATLIPPPAAEEGKVRVFSGGVWAQVEDHRGETWWEADGTAHVMESLGPMPVGALTEAPILPAYPDRAAAQSALIGWIDDFHATVAGNYPRFEVASWPSKSMAARAVLAGNATADQTAMIQNEADLVGETAVETAAIIVTYSDQFEAVISKTTGLRRKVQGQLDAVTDPFDYQTVLLSARDEAIGLAAALGITIPA